MICMPSSVTMAQQVVAITLPTVRTGVIIVGMNLMINMLQKSLLKLWPNVKHMFYSTKSQVQR